jgi:SulP family sulfate permease
MGELVNFISHSVVIGFTAGAAILIATSQFKHYIGVTLPHGQSFVHTWVNLYGKVPDLNIYAYAAATASVTLLAAILFRRYRPRWPGMLFTMVIGSLLSLFIGGEQHGVNLIGSLLA